MIAPTPDCALRAAPSATSISTGPCGSRISGRRFIGDVPEIHQNARRQLLDEAEEMKGRPDRGNPLGWFLTGSGGTGKTHCSSRFTINLSNAGLPLSSST